MLISSLPSPFPPVLDADQGRGPHLANYGYMDTEHAFSAAILLLMVCAAFPHDPANAVAFHDGLTLLASMGHRGNHHIGARCQVLRQLAADIAPGLLPSESNLGDAAAATLLGTDSSSNMLLDTFWDEFLVGMDGMAGTSFGPAAPGYNQEVWDGIMDNVMQD